jgi:hypothetical protein
VTGELAYLRQKWESERRAGRPDRVPVYMVKTPAPSGLQVIVRVGDAFRLSNYNT